ncbi:S1C family serine protease [Sphingomonas sp. 3-13AW]|uniref:S1C family serine protease n=1 Tax=Sphingomonas sp. 3-13AW TaxID=3050450 RepID=UPI003BB68961
MIEKSGSRVELSTWPTTLVLEAPASEGQAAALVNRKTGAVTPLRRSGSTWSADLADIEDELDVVVYRADEPPQETGPNLWTISIAGRTFAIQRSDRSHAAVILMVLYIRQGRRLARIGGDGYAFGVDAYARTFNLNRNAFARISRSEAEPVARPPQGQPSPHGPSCGSLEGQGSGVCVGRGLIVTNHHVIEGVERLVVAHEGRRSDAHVVMTDPQHDIALVRHDLAGLTAVAHRDPAESHLGEEILAAGFPLAQVLGDDLKLTYGDVSGLRGGGDVTRVQFTAPIASGSSGGALLDMSGRLVGVVSSALRHNIFADRGAASENVNFAVKASLVREMLIAAGCVAPEYAKPQPLTRAVLARLARQSVVSVDCYRS